MTYCPDCCCHSDDQGRCQCASKDQPAHPLADYVVTLDMLTDEELGAIEFIDSHDGLSSSGVSPFVDRLRAVRSELEKRRLDRFILESLAQTKCLGCGCPEIHCRCDTEADEELMGETLFLTPTPSEADDA